MPGPIDISEVPDAPRRRTLSFYLVLVFLVLPLWCFVPFSWAYFIYTLRYSTISSRNVFFFGLTFGEVLFSVYHAILAYRVSGPSKQPHGKLTELQIAFTRVLKAGLAQLPEDGFDEETTDSPRPGSPAEEIVQLGPSDIRAIDFRNTLRTWFGRVPWSTITLQPVRQWLYWSMFNQDLPPLETLTQAHRAALEDALLQLQKRLGKEVPEGPASGIKPLRLTLDPVNISWRPLSFYCFVAAANTYLKNKYCRERQFRRGSFDGLEYLIRIPTKWCPCRSPRPVVFFHGLGLGLFQYNFLLRHLAETFTDRPLLVLLQPHISQEIFHPKYLKPMTRKETADRLAGLMTKLGWADLARSSDSSEVDEIASDLLGKPRKGVTFLSHSNGSYGHAWMLKEYPHMVTRSCFVDPVTFCSWEGDVCYNFIYRPSTNGSELIVRYFVGTELGVANFLQRHFDWSSNSLWFEEIPNARDPSKTLFLLGGKDSILNAERVKKYLTSHGVRKGLWYDPNGLHGQALLVGGKGHERVMEWLKEPDF
ncbi:hypothetical protein E1B28_004280 [Marasmius oreades]|uniref:Uncharacterized protein n=1 Tax=Marasmius oreades TaxID=181124 RepID=A0A9P7UY76_9AGAR|nr:uncharacterized protein E1B28_004280 [Marasmius oreades]KAG7096874.1 hypothetical protein E1B28_004280 [Marasmius oreades]